MMFLEIRGLVLPECVRRLCGWQARVGASSGCPEFEPGVGARSGCLEWVFGVGAPIACPECVPHFRSHNFGNFGNSCRTGILGHAQLWQWWQVTEEFEAVDGGRGH